MFCKKCGKELQEGWTACPSCGAEMGKKDGNSNLNSESKKKRGTSNAPMVLGIVGGALGIPSALCSGMCASMIGSVESAELAGELGSFYLIGILLGSIIAIVFSCQSRKNPKLAGIMLIVATGIIGILSLVTYNLLGIIAAILTLIAAILSFVQKKEYV